MRRYAAAGTEQPINRGPAIFAIVKLALPSQKEGLLNFQKSELIRGRYSMRVIACRLLAQDQPAGIAEPVD